MGLYKLTSGKAIGAQEHFVETINSIIDWICNIKGEPQSTTNIQYRGGVATTVAFGITVDRTNPLHPVIKLTGDFSTGVDNAIGKIIADGSGGDTARIAATKLAEDLLATAESGDYVLVASGGKLKLKRIGNLVETPVASIAWLDPS